MVFFLITVDQLRLVIKLNAISAIAFLTSSCPRPADQQASALIQFICYAVVRPQFILQVKEAVTTSALLKLPQALPKADKISRVDAVIQQLVIYLLSDTDQLSLIFELFYFRLFHTLSILASQDREGLLYTDFKLIFFSA